MFPRFICVIFVGLMCAITSALVAPGSDLLDSTLGIEQPGESIIRRDFEKLQPNRALVQVNELELHASETPNNRWIIRHPGWTPILLNATGKPPEVSLEPNINVPCDIYIGMRAVTPGMSFAIKLSSETDFTYITAPAARNAHHYDTEFFWKAHVPLAGEKIILKAIGQPVYLQYLRFVPYHVIQQSVRLATRKMTICSIPGRHLAFPGVARTPGGDLVVVCREGDAHVCPKGRLVFLRSTDRGKTWTPPSVIYDSPSDDRDPSILSLPDGSLAVTFTTWNSWMSSSQLCQQYREDTERIQAAAGNSGCIGHWIMFSKDNGVTWTKPVCTPVFNPHGPILGPEGKLLYYVGPEEREGSRFISIYRSNDSGHTWYYYATITATPPISLEFVEPVPCEPTITILRDGRWIALMRVDFDGYVRQSTSSDGGRTWSYPRKLPVRGYPQHLLQLTDGCLLMSYGFRFSPLGIRACVSSDLGVTWDLQRELVLENDGGHDDLGYPVSSELAGGEVLTVYYHNQNGGNCVIRGAFYRP